MRMTRFLLYMSLLWVSIGSAAVYEVGPGKTLTSIGAVPWATLAAGDTVLIHWRSTPYKEKWVICRQGTVDAPITVRGVPNSSGALPVIDGNGATTPAPLNYTNEVRGLLKIGSANTPSDLLPKNIVIENLDLRSARPAYSFTDDGGNTQSYSKNAASIYVEKCENLTIRNCIVRDSGNGIFIGINNGQTQNILIEGCHIYDNGIESSAFEHNTYTAAVGITYQYNRFGPLRANCDGNNLKDRSIGTVVRYNWIESGNRQLDLVDAEDDPSLTSDPRYRSTYVYGNVLIEPDGAGNSQIVHYGGDSGDTSIYRKGTLYFYNNTVVSTRTGNTTWLRLSTNAETCDARNNIVYVAAAGSRLAMLDADGVLNLSHNWFKTGQVSSHGTLNGTINDLGGNLNGGLPGFEDEAGQNFRILAGSPGIDNGTALSGVSLTSQYVKHRSSETRPTEGPLDIGAYEYSINKAPLIDSGPSANPEVVDPGVEVSFSVSASDSNGDALSYSWTFGDGQSGTGATPTHAYAVEGAYTATVTVSDGRGGSVSGTIAVTVQNGAGGSGGGGGSGGVPPPPADTPLSVTKALIKVFFNAAGRDGMLVMGTVPVTEGFNPEGLTVDFYAHASQYTFVLDAKGRSAKADHRFMLKAKRKKKVVQAGDAKFKILIKKGDFSAAMESEGMTNETIKDKAVDVVIRLTFNGVTYGTGTTAVGDQPLTLMYKGKEGKGGKAKLPK